VNKHRLIKNWCVVYVLRQLNMDRRTSSCSALGGKSSTANTISIARSLLSWTCSP